MFINFDTGSNCIKNRLFKGTLGCLFLCLKTEKGGRKIEKEQAKKHEIIFC